MKIRLIGELDYDLLKLGLYAGKVIDATPDKASTVGGLHFNYNGYCCSIWPENYTTDLRLVSPSMTVFVHHNGYIKKAVVVKVKSDPYLPIVVRFIDEWSGSDSVNTSDILDR